MDDTNLIKLRLLESEMLHLRQEMQRLTERLYQLHEVTCEMLHHELSRPLV